MQFLSKLSDGSFRRLQLFARLRYLPYCTSCTFDRRFETVTRDPRFDILFEPIKIGPVVAKNRFYQVPHCNGMGYARPQAHAAMRGVKAEGGWAVVSTEEVEIHPSSDISPYIEGRLWDDRDVPALALLTDAVHKHGALAAIELGHGRVNASNLYSREVSIAPSPIASSPNYVPAQARGMRKADIRS